LKAIQTTKLINVLEVLLKDKNVDLIFYDDIKNIIKDYGNDYILDIDSRWVLKDSFKNKKVTVYVYCYKCEKIYSQDYNLLNHTYLKDIFEQIKINHKCNCGNGKNYMITTDKKYLNMFKKMGDIGEVED
jgi:predicted metallo-beta-lactamase superfamily hydrolase